MAVKSKGTCMRVGIWRVNLVDEKYGQLYMTTVNDIANVFFSQFWMNQFENKSQWKFCFCLFDIIVKDSFGVFFVGKKYSNAFRCLDVLFLT